MLFSLKERRGNWIGILVLIVLFALLGWGYQPVKTDDSPAFIHALRGNVSAFNARLYPLLGAFNLGVVVTDNGECVPRRQTPYVYQAKLPSSSLFNRLKTDLQRGSKRLIRQGMALFSTHQ